MNSLSKFLHVVRLVWIERMGYRVIFPRRGITSLFATLDVKIGHEEFEGRSYFF